MKTVILQSVLFAAEPLTTHLAEALLIREGRFLDKRMRQRPKGSEVFLCLFVPYAAHSAVPEAALDAALRRGVDNVQWASGSFTVLIPADVELSEEFMVAALSKIANGGSLEQIMANRGLRRGKYRAAVGSCSFLGGPETSAKLGKDPAAHQAYVDKLLGRDADGPTKSTLEVKMSLQAVPPEIVDGAGFKAWLMTATEELAIEYKGKAIALRLFVCMDLRDAVGDAALTQVVDERLLELKERKCAFADISYKTLPPSALGLSPSALATEVEVYRTRIKTLIDQFAADSKDSKDTKDNGH